MRLLLQTTSSIWIVFVVHEPSLQGTFCLMSSYFPSWQHYSIIQQSLARYPDTKDDSITISTIFFWFALDFHIKNFILHSKNIAKLVKSFFLHSDPFQKMLKHYTLKFAIQYDVSVSESIIILSQEFFGVSEM